MSRCWFLPFVWCITVGSGSFSLFKATAVQPIYYLPFKRKREWDIHIMWCKWPVLLLTFEHGSWAAASFILLLWSLLCSVFSPHLLLLLGFMQRLTSVLGFRAQKVFGCCHGNMLVLQVAVHWRMFETNYWQTQNSAAAASQSKPTKPMCLLKRHLLSKMRAFLHTRYKTT